MINSKYFRVPKKKEPLQENEVHITSRQEPINFLRYAIFLFEKRNLPYIKFKASGSAIASLVNISEILFWNLHRDILTQIDDKRDTHSMECVEEQYVDC